MLAADVIRAAVDFDAAIGSDETVLSVLVREGVPYDEATRFALLGPYRAQTIVRGSEDEQTTQGRLWLDGFLLGLRMARAR